MITLRGDGFRTYSAHWPIGLIIPWVAPKANAHRSLGAYICQPILGQYNVAIEIEFMSG
jgi:hypothetical protein